MQDTSPQFGKRTVLSRPEDFFLNSLSYIGVILSMGGLLLTIVSYIGTRSVNTEFLKYIIINFTMVMYRKLRLSNHGQLLLNLCFALLGLYISFIFSIHSSSVPALCAIVSIMLHYFMLVVFMVMAAEAVNGYMKLVVVLGHDISHYVIKVIVICWGKLDVFNVQKPNNNFNHLQLFRHLWYYFALLQIQVCTFIQMCKYRCMY